MATLSRTGTGVLTRPSLTQPTNAFSSAGTGVLTRGTVAQPINNALSTPAAEESTNNGGFLGGLGYLSEKLAVGFVSSLEGLVDYTAGGVAKLFGADEWAEEQFANDWFGDWYSHPEEWYQPSEGWQVAGDVASGIGNTAVSLLGTAAGAGIAVASGGALAPLTAGMIGASLTAGLGAAGNATKEAYRETGKLDGKAFGYGALSGVTEGAMEGITNALTLGTGKIIKGIAGSVGKGIAKGVAKEAAETGVKATLKSLASSFVSEGFEEGMSEVLSPYWKRMTYDPNAENATPEEIGYSFLVGGLAGLFMDGGRIAAGNTSSYLKGNKLARTGGDAEVLALSEQLSSFQEKNQTDYEAFQTVSDTYQALKSSLATTDGKVMTVPQKKMLGDLQKANVSAVFTPLVHKSAVNIVSNADVIAEKLTAYGIKDASGKPMIFTAEQIRAGIDTQNQKTLSKSFTKALEQNSVLRTLAVADATGHLLIDNAKFEEATLTGQRLASQVDINRFYETATPAEINAVSDALQIDNWATLDPTTLSEKITDYLVRGGADSYAETKRARATFEAIPPQTAQKMPVRADMTSDGVRRYTEGGLSVAIEKKGDSYRVYDYRTGKLTKFVPAETLNGLLETYRTQADAVYAEETARQEEAVAIDTFARENVKEYKNLNDANQSMIRRLIRSGRAAGISDTDLATYAKVSARSGLDIVFDKEATARTDASGNVQYADGYYSASENRIVVNPEGTRSAERLLIHELDHAIRQSHGVTAYRKALEGVSDEVRQNIVKNYAGVADAGNRTALVFDETNARYAEDILSNKNTLERLIEAEPTMKERILSFFKGASSDYADSPKLSGAAKKYYRTYEKLFNKFSGRNFQNNATETIIAKHSKSDDFYSRQHLDLNNIQKDIIINIEHGSTPNSDKNGMRYALCEFEDGKRFVNIETEQDQFDGLSVKEQTDLATQIIKNKFQGKVIGIENKAFVNGVTANEYTHPSKHIDEELYTAKMRASTELDNLMDAGFNFRTGEDGLYGHKHPKAVGGFGYFDVIFRVASGYYQGIINIENNRIGKRLKDITKIKNITKDMASQYGNNPKYVFLRDASIDSITDSDEKVNRILEKTDKSFALPDSDGDKVVISKGQAQKIKANYNSDRVYSKKDVTDALAGIEGFSNLPEPMRAELFRNVWVGLNSRYGDGNREIFAEVMRHKIPYMLLTEAYTDENMEKYWQLQAERKKTKKTLRGAALKQKQAEIDRALEALEDAPDRLLDNYEQKRIDEISDEIAVALNKLLTSGRPSLRAKMESEFNASDAGFWKAKYQEGREYNRLVGGLMKQAEKMRSLKLGTFSNATQEATELFNKTIGELSRVSFRGSLNVGGTRKILEKLLQWYQPDNALLACTPEGDSGYYVEGIAEQMKLLVRPDREGKAFTVDELKNLSEVMSYFTKFVENWGKVFRRGKYVEAMPLAQKYVSLIRQNESMRSKAAHALFLKHQREFGDPMSLMRYMDGYQDGFYTESLEELRQGLLNAEITKNRILKPYTEFMKQNRNYLRNATHEEVKLLGGSISRMELISLYMSSKRDQAQAGLILNGLLTINQEGKRAELRGMKPFDSVLTEEELKTEAELLTNELEKLLTERDKQYIAILEAGMKETSRLKAERDMQRFGYTNATEGYYWPIKRADTAKSVDPTSALDEFKSMNNASFNKDTVKGAKQALFIESADTVFMRHLDAVCLYSCVAPAVDAYGILFNLDISGNPNAPQSIATAGFNDWKVGKDLKNIHRGNEYFAKLIADIRGKPAGEGWKLLDTIRGGYARAQLGGNPKVLFTQLSSVFAASSILDAQSIVRGIGVSAKGIDRYCPLAELRNQDGTAAYAQGVLDSRAKRGIDRAGDFLMKGIGFVDRRVVCRLFGACQVQIERDGGASVGTEANKKAAGELLTRVILETQQNTMATERAAAARSGNVIKKTLTMFRSDSIKATGRVLDGVGEVSMLKKRIQAESAPEARAELKKQLKGARRRARKAVAALTASALYMAAIPVLFRFFYNKERDEDDPHPALEYALDAVGNLFGGLPIIGDLITRLIDGYELDNYAYSAVNDLLNSSIELFDVAGDMISGDATAADRNRALRSFAYSVGTVTGLPVRNLYNVFYGLTKRFDPVTAYKIDNAFYKKNYRDDLYLAIENDDAKKSALIISLLVGERIGTEVNDSVLNELLRLSYSGQAVLPRTLYDNITIDGVKVFLNDEQQAQLAASYSEVSGTLEKLLSRSGYQALSDEGKAAAMKYLYDLYYEKGLLDAGFEREGAETSLLLAKAVDPDTLALLYGSTKGLESDVDRKGTTISGSKRKKVVAAINRLNVTTPEKLLLICSKGYSLQDGDIRGMSADRARNMLLRYILHLSGLSRAEKAELAERCGFEVRNGKIIRESTKKHKKT